MITIYGSTEARTYSSTSKLRQEAVLCYHIDIDSIDIDSKSHGQWVSQCFAGARLGLCGASMFRVFSVFFIAFYNAETCARIYTV